MNKSELPEAQNKLVIFQSKKIRRLWHKEEWYYSVVDVCGALMNSPNNLTARKYWNKLSQRLRKEGSEVVTNCNHLKIFPNTKAFYSFLEFAS